ncbi:GNAT family protein [Streptomyces sp. MZ04]|uniref:GNAT family N-acetyltransferase n=1 Tax=Streptomyces sp. MZ04 TaxID=2559236 RepID=UPI00107E6CA8|nr:GNAT family protein [Streptomyces sp. MZ04]TGB15133.1 N-acetyltransferase [Streptomyces sp. MZ04]
MTWVERAAVPLECEHVLLRPLEEPDRPLLHAIAMDPRIWRFFVTRIDTDDDFHAWFNQMMEDQDAGRRVVHCITDKARGVVAGSMGFSNFAESERRLEIGGSWVGSAFQGRGVNRWAKFVMLRHAFEELGAERVEFKTDVLNVQARRALRNIGAVEEGTLRSYNFMPGGRRRDAVYYSVLLAEWAGVKRALTGSVTAPG